MTHSDIDRLRDTLSRIAKVDLDNGTAPDVETAMARLHEHRIGVFAGPEIASSAAHQAALLTLVNIGRRFALGGVLVDGDLDVPLLVQGGPTRSLADEVEAQGGQRGSADASVPGVIIGNTATMPQRGVAVTFEGWRGGIVPLSGARLSDVTTVTPAAVLAGALAAAEVFAMLRGEVEAGHRNLGLSLWRPDRSHDWTVAAGDGPALAALPNHLWILGLGHLGQAFLWTLMLCPYSDRAAVRLVLQDTDEVTGSTDSTSILTQEGMLGRRKTRAVADVLDQQGFNTVLVERPFDGGFRRRSEDDPAVLVCGVDNALARSQVEMPGFPFVVEAGIGASAQDFRALRVHTFPSPKSAAEMWGQGAHARGAADLSRPGYRRLSDAGSDICGLTRLAETAVGAPFVGAVAGCLMLAQVLRVLAGDFPDTLIDLDLRSIRSRRAVTNGRLTLFNPGFQPAA
ncbi:MULTISPECIES: hypothetical protein [Methylobacterium]|uniref:Thiamine biosynthesis protein ThiF n=4 Tax=Pseudomonadota TaxID=1224 RepID=A0ABQ4SQA5_9HYPH|nr:MULTISPECIES: hypothetical protein [Methylobacterium]PIU04814.1 MAG: thiamine biosynthesis protein ThiF [Methylobacterium sp. CG09_land_8_20_14_0_10_71_15]PIU13034.1 MAG: thiamine biosynthesis protein ThiF [Methylobacterium sp. CG08_land_8_20_14_0_20_71_15]GBU15820.1 hypothetical protein AwMethylo_00350 [Methylobacterium sp.]GJE05277.1 hypothetical protein AOPFMNJM_0575 [Methylobacterium jeotgali]